MVELNQFEASKGGGGKKSGKKTGLRATATRAFGTQQQQVKRVSRFTKNALLGSNRGYIKSARKGVAGAVATAARALVPALRTRAGSAAAARGGKKTGKKSGKKTGRK